LLYFADADVPQYRCAGTVINNKFILTALHCVVKDARVNINDLKTYNTTTARVEIRGVKINRNKKKRRKTKKNKDKINRHKLNDVKKDKKERQKRKFRQIYSVGVEEIILHREGADLALVKVKGEINTQIFPPICLPETGDDLQSTSGVVVGYGRNIDNTNPGNKLKELSVPLTKKCPYVESLDNPDTWLCFGGEADRSACTGDSGGPVMVEESGRWTLAGIIAGGTVDGCQNGTSAAGGFGLAVDTYYWINWIRFFAFEGEYCPEN